MDLYQITGDQFYLDAVDGFVDMFAEHFLHVGGTVAIKEWKVYYTTRPLFLGLLFFLY